MIMDLLEKWIQDRNYEGISRMIRYTVDHDYFECFTWVLDLLQEEFEKTAEYVLDDFYCSIGRSIANYDEFAGRLQVDLNAQENEVEKVYDEHGEAEREESASDPVYRSEALSCVHIDC